MTNAPPAVKVFIGLPIYWNVDPLFFQCIMKVIHGSKVPTQICPLVGDSAIGRARNVLTRKFLESDCTHLLFIDSDLVFSVEHIERVVSHGEDIVGGLYCKKQDTEQPQLVLNQWDKEQVTDSRGLMEVNYIGTGFMCIHRSVFEKMIAAFGPEMEYMADETGLKEWDFWRFGVYDYKDGSRRYLSEDWYFCQKAADLGIKIWADMGVLCRHVGHAQYPLSHQEKYLFPSKEDDVDKLVKSLGKHTFPYNKPVLDSVEKDNSTQLCPHQSGAGEDVVGVVRHITAPANFSDSAALDMRDELSTNRIYSVCPTAQKPTL